jgi:hypothetical protein
MTCSGGKHGPLRTLTRAVTYGLMFFLGYLVFLPLRFSAIAALGTGGMTTPDSC